jgi:hypothetical protein
VGTRDQEVRTLRFKPNESRESNAATVRHLSSVEKCTLWLLLKRITRARQCAARKTISRKLADYRGELPSLRTSASAIESNRTASRCSEMYGFPTVDPVASCLTALELIRCHHTHRRKVPPHPRPRESIADEIWLIPRSKHFRLTGRYISLPPISLSFNGAVMACAGRILIWWDRDFDSSRLPIRSDVRSAGGDLWEQACRHGLNRWARRTCLSISTSLVCPGFRP